MRLVKLGRTEARVKDILWVIQDNLGHGHDVDRLASSLRAEGLNHLPVQIVPFSDEVPDVTWDGPIIAYGSARFIANVQRRGLWSPGTFFDAHTFTMGNYIGRYGQNMLNASAEITTISGFLEKDALPHGAMFVRPDRDLKEFEARVWDPPGLKAWFTKICDSNLEVRPDTPIVVAEWLAIETEWRVFMVDGCYVSGSRYRSWGEIDVDSHVPQDVIEFAGRMAEIWTPANVYVVDIALLDGHLKIVELNCFNSAGFYASDVARIVEEVSASV